MTVLHSRDALSDKVGRVAAESHLFDVLDDVEIRHATHVAVFDGDRFRGIVALQDILLSSPQRIFADLHPEPPALTVSEHATLEEISRVMRESLIGAVAVIGTGGRLIGVVTAQSLLHASLAQTRQTLEESDRLRVIIEADRDRARQWAGRLTDNEVATRKLLTLISTGAEEHALLQYGIELLTQLTHAQYGAIGVFDDAGGLRKFIHTGLTPDEAARIGEFPKGLGLLGVLTQELKPIRLDDLTKHARSCGFPPNHPAMRTFLGVPIAGPRRVSGRVYLAEKIGD